MKNLTKRITSIILTLSMILSLSLPAFATGNNQKNNFIHETTNGIIIDNKHYSYDEFVELLNTAEEIKTPKMQTSNIQNRSMGPGIGSLVAGSFAIPGIGPFVITAAGIIIFSDQIIDASSKIYSTIMTWFKNREHIAYQKVVDSIPKKLRDGNEVDLGKFKTRVGKKDNVGYQENVTGQGWVIQKDDAGDGSHGGSAWKLKTKKQFDKKGKDRTATLNKDGKVLRD